MKIGKYGLDAPLFIGIILILLLPALIGGYGYANFFHVKSTILGSIFYWFLVLTVTYFIVNIFLLILRSVWGKVRLVRKIVTQLHLKGDEEVLDVGCGIGVFSIETAFYLKTGTVKGIDTWNENRRNGNGLQEAKNNAKDHDVDNIVSFEAADVKEIPCEDNRFDLVAAILFIDSFHDKKEREQILSEMARVLKPGGRILIVDIHYTSEYASFYKDLGWRSVKRSSRRWTMFPPTHIVTAIKPIPKPLPRDEVAENAEGTENSEN